MKKLIIPLLLMAFLTGCSQQQILVDSVANTPRPTMVVNAASKHLTADGKDGSNGGIGLRSKSIEVGFYDNSRKHKSYAYYIQKRVVERGVLFVDTGLSYYDGGTDEYPYRSHVVPILAFGASLKYAELGYALPDSLFLRFKF